MPAAAVLTEAIKKLIARIYLADKTAPAKEVRDKVHVELGRSDWPKLSVIQRELKKIRDKDKTVQPEGLNLDEPWHLGLMGKPECATITPEALPYIFLVQEWLEIYPDTFNNPPPQAPLAIREALWVARLRGILKDLRLAKHKNLPHIARFLFLWAKAYAQRERICELSGTPFDTSAFDRGYRQHGYPITIDKTTLIYFGDSSLELDTIDKDLLHQIEQMEKEGEK